MNHLQLKFYALTIFILALFTFITVHEFDHSLLLNKTIETFQNKTFGDDCSELISSLQNEVEELQNLSERDQAEIEDLKYLVQKQNDSRNENDDGGNVTLESPSSLFAEGEICSYFPSSPFTASSIWPQYLDRIFHASHNPDMPPEMSIYNNTQEATKMHELLHNILTPSRMRKGLLHMPTLSASHEIVKKVVRIIENRIRDPINHPRLRVAVLGGSVTTGRLCRKKGIEDRPCAWPRRFELLINQFIGTEVIEVYNLAIGGTNSAVGAQIVEYWMYPKILKQEGPDVIINSYSTNDASPPWTMAEGDDPGFSVMKRLLGGLQTFIRVALSSKACSIPPLVINVDDYLVPQHKAILDELSYKTTMSQLAKWYDTVAISYAEMVRDIAYGNTTDTTFFKANDVHFGYWVHQTIAWSVGFGSLDLLSHYCDDEFRLRSITAATALVNGNDEKQPDLHFLPPPLTKELKLKNVTTEFDEAKHHAIVDFKCGNDDEKLNAADEGNTESASLGKNPCVISWISSPGMYGKSDVERFMNSRMVHNQDWNVENSMKEGWANKVGWIANSPNATFTIGFKENEIDKEVNAVTIVFMRSYGEKWADSRARFTFTADADDRNDNDEGKGNESTLLEADISGVHNVTLSLSLSEKFMLPQTVTKGQKMKMKVDLISGSTFKIMGIMLCRY